MRFQLNSTEPAMAQLLNAARQAAVVVLRRRNFYGLTFEERRELVERVQLAATEHFLEYKVRRHGYVRVTKEGQSLTFFDNVLSSAWSCNKHVADRLIHEIDERIKGGMRDAYDFVVNKEKLPLYVADYNERSKTRRKKPMSELYRVADRAKRVREEFEDYTDECRELGVTALDWEDWMASTGYGEDSELVYALLSPEEKKDVDRAEKEAMLAGKYAHLTPSQRHTLEYQREYKRKKRAERNAHLDTMSKELEVTLGSPPPGYRWVERNGIAGIQKIK